MGNAILKLTANEKDERLEFAKKWALMPVVRHDTSDLSFAWFTKCIGNEAEREAIDNASFYTKVCFHNQKYHLIIYDIAYKVST